MEVHFQTHPDVQIGSNTFKNVPIILQFEDTPLLEVGKFVEAGYQTRFSVFNADGIHVAVVVGSQIRLTKEGKNARITQRFEPNLTVCELEGKPILEMKRIGAIALKGWAELYTPTGALIKVHDSGVSGLLKGGGSLVVGGICMEDSILENFKIGVQIKSGVVYFGVGGGSMKVGRMYPLQPSSPAPPPPDAS